MTEPILDTKTHYAQKSPRREFIKNAAIFGGTIIGAQVTIGGLILQGLKFLSEQSTKNTDKPSTQDITSVADDLKTAQAQVQQTATAMSEQGVENSFKPTEGFTEEMFKKLSKATLRLRMRNKNTPPNLINGATGFVVSSEIKDNKNVLTIVTNRHAVSDLEDETPINSLTFSRPDIDPIEYAPSSFTLSFYPISTKPDYNDIALIRCTINTPSIPIETVSWEDDVSLKKNTAVLIVGYPGVFNNRTMGFVTHIKRETEQTYGTCLIDGPIIGGVSGSPIATIDDDGKINVKGIVFSGGTVGIGRRLSVNSLLQAFK